MLSAPIILTHFKKSDRLLCFVLGDTSSVLDILTSFHGTSDKSNIFLNVLAVTGPNPWRSKLKVIEHDLAQLLPDLGYFDAIVSSLLSTILNMNASMNSMKKFMTSSIQPGYFVI